ncbi:uncharacterized protein LOC141720032 [Apium graveolens]|uniref:uncharacterized protein LOC141720032 n=1 Tax=Apium graveolens TaxID=4045 RepID=UPI003D7B37C5
MEIALSSKLKLGFVDGTYVRSAVNSVLLIYWICCNNMVTSWILNSVSLDIAVHAIWEDLKVRYDQTNVPKLLNLRKELSHLTQGMMSITAYFTKFRTIHDELECLSAKPRCTCTTCTCTINSKLEAYDQTVQLTQILMGLNEHFTGVRGQILIMTPLPSLSQCYSILLQEENKREISTSTVSLNKDNIAMSIM